MELWVRSQSKLGLYVVDEIYIDERDFGNDDIQYYIMFGQVRLGRYKSKERALQILDEIQALLKPKYILDSSSIKPDGNSWVENGMILQNYNANAKIEELSTYVYEMPEE